jgi:eukaryotic-like serine/threonine-protein kinase
MMQQSTWRAGSMGDLSPDLRIGSYHILEPLGTGGMSSVYRAVHQETRHEVALKVLTLSLARNSTLLQRFLREARSAETLEHPNIVAIYDRGIDQGRHYLVLEYVPGGDFHQYVQRYGPLGAGQAIAVVRGVASGLKYAASRGLIHRDIKPSNILRTPAGQGKIIDLGLALQSEFEDERVTREGTTVGTVDYMAPEQARDSRATSIQSDMYSLGCTFYYLLSGVPPYPGGDITDKLTRHARSPVPDIRDLRPDIPTGVASIVMRMMAKEPSDRFVDYDELITALDAVPIDQIDTGPAIALVPLSEEQCGGQVTFAGLPRPGPHLGGAIGGGRSGDLAAELEPLAELDDISVEPRTSRSRPPVPEGRGLPLTGVLDDLEEPAELAGDAVGSAPIPAARPPGFSTAWILPSCVIALVFVLMAYAAHELIVWSGGPIETDQASADREPAEPWSPVEPSPTLPTLADSRPSAEEPERHRMPVPRRYGHPPSRGASTWVEPPDIEPVPGVAVRASGGDENRRLMPEWSRTPIVSAGESPVVVVRRVPESNDSGTIARLETALDEVHGGTVELADEGPLPVEEFRVSGQSRVIRARAGFRPILWIRHSDLEATRQRSAFAALNRKNLTLEGVDLIVDVRELGTGQKVLFACTSSNLTIRDCTITALNPRRTELALIRAESSSARPSRILLERTLVRGGFTTAVELSGDGADLAVYRSVILGGSGPLVRTDRTDGASAHRLDFVDAILAGPGPVVERALAAAPGKPLVVRAFGSTFGRLNVPGIASVITSSIPAGEVRQLLDWRGDRNTFAGWMGFFAHGSEPTIAVNGLAALRSTWNESDPNSEEVLAPWPQPTELATVAPDAFQHFLANRSGVRAQVARPRAGLFEKTVSSYTIPMIPETVSWALDPRRNAGQLRVIAPLKPSAAVEAAPKPSPTGQATPVDGVVELVWNTADSPWHGDLGTFLATRLSPDMKSVRVRVQGTGQHRFTPVVLTPGLRLEIRVESGSGVEPPSWSSESQATGPALIVLRGGALVLSHLSLRHDSASRLESLIAVEDSHLVLSHSQLTAPPGSARATGGLITFRASTQPKANDPAHPLFSIPVDRPVCRLLDSILIANGTALRAELGRGLVAVTQCAVAAGDAAVEIIPAHVARNRFEVDVWLDQSTVGSERSIVRLGPWPGLAYGPDRPCLVTSRNCAFLALSDRRPRETAMLRADADALARGTISWQAANDALDVDILAAATTGDGPPPARARDLPLQWIHFWGANHFAPRITGPRSVRLRERRRSGEMEPADLILDPSYHPDRALLDVGANLALQGVAPRAPRSGSFRP